MGNNIKYDNIIETLRKIEPELHNSDILTNDILNIIQKPTKNYSISVVRIMRPVMTAAAVFLFGLFVVQYMEVSNVQEASVSYTSKKSIQIESHKCITEEDLKSENFILLFEKYKCYLKENFIENQKIKNLIIKQFS